MISNYLISVVVFFGISFYLSYLIGKYSNYKKYEALNDQIDALKGSYEESNEKRKELETQIKEQSKFYNEEIDKAIALRRRVEQVELKKNKLNDELNGILESFQKLAPIKEQYAQLIAQYNILDRESLVWKNKYIALHRDYNADLSSIRKSLDSQKRYLALLLDQKYELLEKWNREITTEPNVEIPEVQINVEKKNEISEEVVSNMELKIKRQENIIKALRIQLKHLNLKQIDASGIETTPDEQLDAEDNIAEEPFIDIEEGFIEMDLDEGFVDLVEENNFHEVIEEERDFYEVIDEDNEETKALMDKLKEFKEIKVRKTGDTLLNYSKVNEKVQQSKGVESSAEGNDKVNSPEDISADLQSIIADNKGKNSRLSLIFNINRATQSKLFSLGIKSFTQLSKVSDHLIDELEDLLEIDRGRIRNEKWVEQARKLSSNSDDIRSLFIQTTQKKLVDDIDMDAYDLLHIKGIGNTYRDRLSKIGITNIKDLASWDENNLDELAELIRVSVAKIVRQNWINQAKALVNELTVDEDFSLD